MNPELRALAFNLLLEMSVAERSAPFLPKGEHHGKGGRQFHCVCCGVSGGLAEHHTPACPVGVVLREIHPYLVPWEQRTPEELAIADASEAAFAAWCASEKVRVGEQ